MSVPSEVAAVGAAVRDRMIAVRASSALPSFTIQVVQVAERTAGRSHGSNRWSWPGGQRREEPWETGERRGSCSGWLRSR